ncbi:transmembrane amino acid transporter [Leucosporidium creatinivorum]|uniref:Transmembrane amino acid transporter n=1 Tax=Leucosporidium creatinivorum TaxID=106004 RepID=A0A1Y2G0X9_9BASI|nr:transmembrane amino acid transporter [Leucosporidium creatinivorum]
MGLFERQDKVDEGVEISVGRPQEPVEEQGVFGATEEGGVNYKTVSWTRASVVLMKAQIGLGVLGIPSIFQVLGLIPGIILLLVVYAMASFSAWAIPSFVKRHPEVHSIADVGFVMGGTIGREAYGLAFMIFMLCVVASGSLGVSIALNAVSEHAICSVGFVAVAIVVVLLLASIQTLDRVSWLGWVGMVSIMSAILTLTIAVGVQSRPAAAPAAPAPWDKNFQLFGNPTWAEAGSTLGTIVFAYGATPAFFNVIAEMKRPQDFPKTAMVCQTYATIVYLAIGIPVYWYCGDYVASPALGSAGPLLKKICYGLSIPALVITAVIYAHLSAKYMFVRILRGSRHLVSNTPQHWCAWIGSVVFCCVIGFIIAEGIPVFSGLISIVGAIFGTVMCIQTQGAMWLYDHSWGAKNAERRKNRSWRYVSLTVWCYFLLIGGSIITVLGAYGSITEVINTYSGKSLTAFSCADNSA